MARKKPDPNRVRLLRYSMGTNGGVIWDVFTRTSGVLLGDVRYHIGEPNPYTAWTRQRRVGYYRTRGAAVAALLDAVRAEVQEAIA